MIEEDTGKIIQDLKPKDHGLIFNITKDRLRHREKLKRKNIRELATKEEESKLKARKTASNFDWSNPIEFRDRWGRLVDPFDPGYPYNVHNFYFKRTSFRTMNIYFK